MPVLVLLLSLIGNYFIFRDSGELLTEDFTISEVSSSINSGSSFFDLYSESSSYEFGFYFNSSISNELIYSYISSNSNSLDFVDYSSYLGIPLYSCTLFDFTIHQINEGFSYTATASFNLLKIYDDFILAVSSGYYDNTYMFIWSSSDFVVDSWIISEGWNNGFDNSIYLDTPYLPNSNEFSLDVTSENQIYYHNFLNAIKSFVSYSTYITETIINTNNSYNFVIPQVINDKVYYMSFFDVSLFNTDNTFIKFQLPFLRNAFESVFNILNFESSYVSSFVLTSFTWMIQLLLLHVVVDTLAFIFKMYHKLMDKVV